MNWTDPFQLDTRLKKVRIVSDTKEAMRSMKKFSYRIFGRYVGIGSPEKIDCGAFGKADLMRNDAFTCSEGERKSG